MVMIDEYNVDNLTLSLVNSKTLQKFYNDNTRTDDITDVISELENETKSIDQTVIQSYEFIEIFLRNSYKYPSFLYEFETSKKYTKSISIREMDIGDAIKVIFTPYSYYNIHTYEKLSFLGMVFYIDIINNNALFYYDILVGRKVRRVIRSLELTHVGYSDVREYECRMFKKILNT